MQQSREAPLTQRQEADLSDLWLRYRAPRLERSSVRARSLREAAQFGSIFTDDEGRTRSYASLIPDALKYAEQLERKGLPKYTERARIRLMLGDKIERVLQLPNMPRWLERYPMRLRLARRTGSYGVNTKTGRLTPYWDQKAGLSRLCPDDAREEAQRFSRRVQPTLEEWVARGRRHELTYMVLTQPNSAPRKLRAGMEKIYRDWNRLWKSGAFPEIKGAAAVLEAPLGAARDWNVHLNLIVMHDAFIDWGKFRHRWHWNVQMKKLPRGPGAIGAALRELIKYVVAATVAKSDDQEKKRGRKNGVRSDVPDTGRDEPDSRGGALDVQSGAAVGVRGGAVGSDHYVAGVEGDREDLRGPGGAPGGKCPPPMREWTDAECGEWLVEGMHGFRRTRSYGLLYNLGRPETEKGRIVHVGQIWWQGDHYEHHLALLDSILEDKSALDVGPQDPRTTWQRFRHRLKLNHLEPIGEIAVTVNDIRERIEQDPQLLPRIGRSSEEPT